MCSRRGKKFLLLLLMSLLPLKKIFQSKEDERKKGKLFYTFFFAFFDLRLPDLVFPTFQFDFQWRCRLRNELKVHLVFELTLFLQNLMTSPHQGCRLNVCHANEMIRLRQSSKCLSAFLSFPLTWLFSQDYFITHSLKMPQKVSFLQRPRSLKITEKVSFNIASEMSYFYILSGQKIIKNAKNCPFWRVFENLKLPVKQCYQTGQF